jgi:hypothetical protein
MWKFFLGNLAFGENHKYYKSQKKPAILKHTKLPCLSVRDKVNNFFNIDMGCQCYRIFLTY